MRTIDIGNIHKFLSNSAVKSNLISFDDSSTFMNLYGFDPALQDFIGTSNYLYEPPHERNISNQVLNVTVRIKMLNLFLSKKTNKFSSQCVDNELEEFQVDFLNTTSRYLQFDYSLRCIANHNKLLVELAKTRIYNKTDLVLFATSWTQQRFDTLPPLFAENFNLFFQKPQMIVSPTYFLSVFSPLMWLSIVMIILIASFFLTIHNRVLIKFGKINIFDAILHINDIVKHPSIDESTISYKLIATSYALLVLCVAGGFSAFLMSELSISNFFLPFSTLDDMKNQLDYNVCAGVYTKEYIYMKQNQFGNILNTEKCRDVIENDFAETSEMSVGIICKDPYVSYMASKRNMQLILSKMCVFL